MRKYTIGERGSKPNNVAEHKLCDTLHKLCRGEFFSVLLRMVLKNISCSSCTQSVYVWMCVSLIQQVIKKERERPQLPSVLSDPFETPEHLDHLVAA